MTVARVAFGLAVLALAACGPAPEAGPEPAPAEPPAPVVTAAMLERGHTLYVDNCVPCHGAGGRGDGPSSAHLEPKPRDHTDRAYMKTLSDEDLAATIRNGGVLTGMPQMPSHPHIQGEDMDALLAFVRSLSEPSAEVARID